MSNVIYTKQKWSAAAAGNRPIAVAATASPGTLLHTAVSGTTEFDEFWLWATNTNTTAARVLTIELGGTSASDRIKFTVGIEDTVLVIPGQALQNGVVVRAFGSVASAFNVFGFVNRITPNP